MSGTLNISRSLSNRHTLVMGYACIRESAVGRLPNNALQCMWGYESQLLT